MVSILSGLLPDYGINVLPESITSVVSSAALASKPTLRQHIIMLVKSSRPPGWTFGPILYGIGAIHSGFVPKTLWAAGVALVQVATLSFPLCIGESDRP